MGKWMLTKEKAIECMTNAIEEVYRHNPTSMCITLSGSVIEVPILHVEYDAYAYDAIIGRQENDKERSAPEGGTKWN